MAERESRFRAVHDEGPDHRSGVPSGDVVPVVVAGCRFHAPLGPSSPSGRSDRGRSPCSQPQYDREGVVQLAQFGRTESPHRSAEPLGADGGRLLYEHASRRGFDLDGRTERPRRRRRRGRGDEHGREREQFVRLDDDRITDSALLRAPRAARTRRRNTSPRTTNHPASGHGAAIASIPSRTRRASARSAGSAEAASASSRMALLRRRTFAAS